MGFVFDFRKFWNVGRFVGFHHFSLQDIRRFSVNWIIQVLESQMFQCFWIKIELFRCLFCRDLCWSTQCSPLVGLCIWSALALDYFCKPSQELGGAWWTRASPHPNAGHGWPMLFFEFFFFTFFLPLEPSALMNAFIKLWLSGEAFPIDIGGTKTLRMMRFPIKSVFEPQNLPKTLCNWQLFHNLLQVHFPFYNHKRRSFLWLSETGSFALDCHGIEHPKLVEERLRRPHSYGPACASLVTVIVLGTKGAFEETTVTEQMMDFLSSPIRVVSDTRNWFKTIRGASCSGECRICFS